MSHTRLAMESMQVSSRSGLAPDTGLWLCCRVLGGLWQARQCCRLTWHIRGYLTSRCSTK